MFDQLLEWISPARFENITISLGGSLAGTFGGALAGAWAAERIAAKRVRFSQIKQEVQDTNAAILLSYSICNICLIFKRDHIQPLFNGYTRQLAAIQVIQHARLIGSIPADAEFALSMEQQSFETLRAPSSRLESLVLEKISGRGKIGQLAITTCRSFDSLNQSISDRNRLLEDYNRGRIPEDQKFARFFALPLADGTVDAVYRDLVLNAYRQTDDCIHFSMRLMEELNTHGKGLRKSSPRNLRRQLPRIASVDFSKTRSEGILPNPDEFEGWEKAFVARVPASRHRYLDKFIYILRRAGRRLFSLIPA